MQGKVPLFFNQGVRRQKFSEGATLSNNDVMMMSQGRILPKKWGGGLKQGIVTGIYLMARPFA